MAKTPDAVRSAAVEAVRDGEPLDQVALKYGISPTKLTRWTTGSAQPDADAPSAAQTMQAQPTIIDVAERAQVSKSVVSRALRGQYGVSDAARERVQRAADELGFVLNSSAQRLSARRTNSLGVLVRDASAAFYGEMQSALQVHGRQRGQRVFITSGALDQDDEVQALEDLVSLRVDGLVVCSGRLDTENIARFAANFPVVVAGRVEEDPRLRSVYGDEDAGSAALADHLVTLGHRRVAVLQPVTAESPALHRRAQVMATAVGDAGAQADLIPVLDAAAAVRISVPDECTAIMCPNDRYAAAILASGRTDLSDRSITGFDGVGGLASELIGITTWVQPIGAIGVAAIDDLLQAVSGVGPIRHRQLPGQLRPSRSTHPPRENRHR